MATIIEIAYAVLGFSLMFVGVIGFSFRPPEYCVGSGNAIKSLCIYYSLLALFLTADIVSYIARHGKIVAVELAFALLLLYVTSYGLKILKNAWRFEIDKVKDSLLYGSVVYLMDEQLFQKFSNLSVVIDMILLVLVAWLVAMLGYILLKYRKVKFFMAFEDYQLVSIVYMTSFFIGLCLLNFEFIGTLPCILTAILTLYSQYVVITKYLKPLLS